MKKLLFILFAALILRLVCFTGIIGADDRHYIHYACQMLNSTYQPDPHSFYSLRLGLLIPLSFAFKIFGIHEVNAILLSLLFSLGTVCLMYLLGKALFDSDTGMIAALLWATLPIDVAYSTMLWPDTQMIFLSLLSIILLFRAEKMHKPALFFVSGLCLGLSYSTKIMTVVLIPLVALYAARNILTRREHFSRYLIYAAGFLSVFLAESLYFYTSTGDFFFHYHTLNNVYNENIYSGIRYAVSGGAMLKRLTLDLPLILSSQVFHYSFLYWLVPGAVIAGLRDRRETSYLIIWWFTGLFLLFDIMPSSLTRYQVLYLDAREVMLLLIPAVILVARYLPRPGISSTSSENSAKISPFTIVLILLALCPLFLMLSRNVFFSASNFLYDMQYHVRTFSENKGLFIKLHLRLLRFSFILSGLAVILLAARLINQRIYRRMELFTAARPYCACIILVNILCACVSPVSEARNAREIFKFLHTVPPKTVYADFVNKEVLRFYAGFRDDSRFRDLDSTDSASIHDAYVVVDKDLLTYTMKLNPRVTAEPFASLLRRVPGNWELLKQLHPEWENNAAEIYYAR